jgi:hypothetical protein
MYELQLPDRGTLSYETITRWGWSVAQNWGLMVTHVTRKSLFRGRQEFLVFSGPSADVARVEAAWMHHLLGL